MSEFEEYLSVCWCVDVRKCLGWMSVWGVCLCRCGGGGKGYVYVCLLVACGFKMLGIFC